MMDAERLLGALLTRGLGGKRTRRRRRRGRGTALSSLMGTTGGTPTAGALGMGALGVAIAAFEHFAQKPGQPSSGQPSPHQPPPKPPQPGGLTPPPPPRVAALPPPPPNAVTTTGADTAGEPPPPPGASPAATPGAIGQTDAILLIRAMIVAARADGEIDANERQTIVDELDEAGLGAEEHEFVMKELASPPTFDQIITAATSPGLKRQVYAASLAAIDVDTPSERGYLQMLAHRLAIDDAEVAAMHERLGIER